MLTSQYNQWRHSPRSPRGPQWILQPVIDHKIYCIKKTESGYNVDKILILSWIIIFTVDWLIDTFIHFVINKKTNIFFQQVLTKGNPKPALAQLTDDSCSLSWSAIGLARFGEGNTGPWQTGHWYPAGAVWRGSRDAKVFRQDQWKTSG